MTRHRLGAALAGLALIATACSSTEPEQPAPTSEHATTRAAPSAVAVPSLHDTATKAYSSSNNMQAAVTPACDRTIRAYSPDWYSTYDDITITIVNADETTGTVTTQIDGQNPSTDHWIKTNTGWRLNC